MEKRAYRRSRKLKTRLKRADLLVALNGPGQGCPGGVQVVELVLEVGPAPLAAEPPALLAGPVGEVLPCAHHGEVLLLERDLLIVAEGEG